ncbi:hypothetical protein PR202_ga09596 [Eleusine coracana subsp. coracana]|uniref:Uncharacterized protein n=1 Tax=Eleusine coracana subsp. coracana TaxID=191504 RepID=A0AAV5C559_ELECO|nr:hypothetical protein PR202_ga09596 [Eleusine coracana subsp. coracana]
MLRVRRGMVTWAPASASRRAVLARGVEKCGLSGADPPKKVVRLGRFLWPLGTCTAARCMRDSSSSLTGAAVLRTAGDVMASAFARKTQVRQWLPPCDVTPHAMSSSCPDHHMQIASTEIVSPVLGRAGDSSTIHRQDEMVRAGRGGKIALPHETLPVAGARLHGERIDRCSV